ncbi:flavin reductase family protein [Cohaesibacter gelatinilyticus]|uniref:NADH-FMN oxidoreductase RutF, flavin reductase (DIM6/NTAB) family n=1 Tax=Cohaesibacter gelatinilyticus TaxID=372072 RepID=A0A285NGQ7_9HYPH|nr:flavin reductase family protein [Cohaesibacter gelatinilyticus]SNZ08458.1 NADH-FMN oxidoreductase RutF, flavin reductase (DIM6/NTAB) family [Cohaesibacter gelatinilyticus]HAT85912.1 flavin reductase family protein [Hyphomicrobiales bacterium]
MFYRTNEAHGLPHDPFKALVAPRPIGWISTQGADGVANLAPYSFFNAISSQPNIVMFSSQGRKDSLANIEDSGEFACNLASYDLRNAMNASAAMVEADVDEFELAGLTKRDCRLIAAPCVAESPVVMECRLLEVIRLDRYENIETPYQMVLGEVMGIFIKDEMIVEGIVDITKLKPLARLGYKDYSVVDAVFSIERPK